MRFTFLYFFVFLCGAALKGQDTLVKRNGDTLIIKLTEVNQNNIRYKLFDYPDGPIFTAPKEEIKLIIYQNGKRELFDSYVSSTQVESAKGEDLSLFMGGKFFYYKERRIKEPDMLALVYKLNDKGLNAMGKKIERLRVGQNIATICAATFFAYGFYTFQVNNVKPVRNGGRTPVLTSANVEAQNRGKFLMLGGLISGVVSVSLMFERKKHDRLIVDAYNQRISKRP